MTSTPPAGRAYSRQVIAAWLHGYTTGHASGWHDGRAAGHAEGYDAGHADGIPAGRDQADHEAAERFRHYRAMSDAIRPNLARPRPYGEAKPLPTPTECLATWPATPALHAVRDAA
ncbi:hypothetical protein ACFT2C_09175 [Promicromonospora sp. NPDC057138]|uniref:hypothetical protein n=1 Tax=Promicromonospora sp. NPDC057138 TaxID=3346031 RepID=UPI0036447623